MGFERISEKGKMKILEVLQTKGDDISEEDAFLNFNFAPPSVRRDIGITGLFHKRLLGKVPPVFSEVAALSQRSVWVSESSVTSFPALWTFSRSCETT